jgi:hypothetical protein
MQTLVNGLKKITAMTQDELRSFLKESSRTKKCWVCDEQKARGDSFCKEHAKQLRIAEQRREGKK